jgi:hypothetical protein
MPTMSFYRFSPVKTWQAFSAVKKWHVKKSTGLTKAGSASVGFKQQRGPNQGLIAARLQAGRALDSISLGPILVCKSISEWLQPECNMYNGMCVPRKQLWADIQKEVNLVARSGAFGENEALHEDICASSGRASEQRFCAELAQKAQRIAAKATRAGVPSGLGRLIQNDFQKIAVVMAQMVPTAKMKIKLELMGESVCSRWHQDNYTARTVVSYNLCGTEYIDDNHVNFWALKNGGTNEHIIRDTSKVCSANVGDFFFIKGANFPFGVKGLVHKAPEIQYHRCGRVKNRLVLKVDLL